MRRQLAPGEDTESFIDRYEMVMQDYSTVWNDYHETSGTVDSDCCLFTRSSYYDEKLKWADYFNGSFESFRLPEGDHDEILDLPGNIDMIAGRILADVRTESQPHIQNG